MTKPQIISETPITLVETKRMLEKIKKRDKEFSFRSGKTYDYLLSIGTKEEEKVEELVKKIEELNIPRMKKEHIVKLVDLKPESIEEIKIILQEATITAENLKKIESVIVKNAN
ncbi:MAG: hypothetical protein QXG86_00555 [Candidatus Woesearchaeota archaeon]